MICPDCRQQLVEVDNPMRREFRHRRGTECTPPAPLDLDAIKARYDALKDYFPIAGGTFRAEHVNAVRDAQQDVPALLDELANERWLRENAGKVCDSAVAATHEIAKQRDAALDELATERRQGAAMASITGEAIRQIGEERDAAREELAKTRAELDTAYAALKAIDEHVCLLESEIGDHQDRDYDRSDPDDVYAAGHTMGRYAEHEKITRELLEMLNNDAVRLATGVTCQPGQPWSCGDAHTAGHCVRTMANPATTAEPADEPKATCEPCCSDHNWNDLCSFVRFKRNACCGDCPDWNTPAVPAAS